MTPSASGFVKEGSALNVSGSDTGSGVKTITYLATGAQAGSGNIFAAGATDPLSVATSLLLTAQGTTTFVFTATDLAGNVSSTATVTVNVDATAPTVTCAVPPVAWSGHDVSVPCIVTDALSGLASPSQSTTTVTTTVPAGTATAAASTNTATVCDEVGNCATVGPFGPFEVDKSVPSASATTTPAPSASGWVSGTTMLNLAATDTGSGVLSITYTLTGAQSGGATIAGASGSVALTTAGTTTVQVHATDKVGNVSPTTTLIVKDDKLGPTITCTPPTSATWSATDISVPCTATDSQAGLSAASPTPQSPWGFSLSTSVAVGTETATATTGTLKVCDEVGNCTTAGPYGPFKVDKKAPTITITAPVAGSTYFVGQSVKAAYTCGDAGSGLASCTGTVTNGAAIATNTVGSYTFTVTAKDKAGNTGTQTVSYTVANRLCAVISPAPQSSSAVLFTVRLCDSQGHNLTNKTVLTAARVDASGAPVSVIPDPKNTFFFVPVVNTDIYILQDSKLASGSHILYVTVAGDPALHPISFTVSH